MGLIDKAVGTTGVATSGMIGLGTAYYIGQTDNLQDTAGVTLAVGASAFTIGSAVYAQKKWLGNKALSATEWVGDKALKVGEVAGGKIVDKSISIGERAKTLGKDLWEGKYDKNFKSAGNALLDKGERVANSWVKIKDEGKLLPSFSPKKKGWAVIGGLALLSTAGAITDEAEARDAGVIDPYMTGPAPTLPSYEDNAGATGDLVFALHKNARAF